MSDEKKQEDHRQLPKRFFDKVTFEATEDGFQIMLDGRPVKTPQKQFLLSPSQIIAEKIRHEWDSQIDVIDPHQMMLTKIINTAIDRIPEHKEAVIDELVTFAGTDMICYRATDPESLVALQKEKWDPLLAWVSSQYDISLKLAEGIIHCDQEPTELEKIRAYLTSKSAYFIAAFHALTTLSGSVIVAMACASGHVSVDDAWEYAHLDANWQALRWGIDQEAQIARENAFKEFKAAAFVIKNL